MRQCKTREIKQKIAVGRQVKVGFQVKGKKLFSGSLHFVALSFPNGLAVAKMDLQTAIKYTLLASPVISRYCSAYGANSLRVNQTILSYSPDATTYNNLMLAEWADDIAKQNSIQESDCLVFLNPQGAINSDADASKGVLGYHNMTSSGLPYCFVNASGTGFTIDDSEDLFAVALSHEMAEMCVDPAANLANPEVCDECAGNCNTDLRNFFDSNSNWIPASQSSVFPPNFSYAFFTDGVVLPADVKQCPAPVKSCQYAPPEA